MEYSDGRLEECAEAVVNQLLISNAVGLAVGRFWVLRLEGVQGKNPVTGEPLNMKAGVRVHYLPELSFYCAACDLTGSDAELEAGLLKEEELMLMPPDSMPFLELTGFADALARELRLRPTLPLQPLGTFNIKTYTRHQGRSFEIGLPEDETRKIKRLAFAAAPRLLGRLEDLQVVV